MKKIFSIILYITISLLLIFTIKSSAASLDKLVITTDKQTIHPGENVVVNIDFGQNLGAYTFDVAYDNNLFEYVTSNGGTANDTGSKVRVFYFDQTGGTTPRANMSVTFKAKSGITTSNPTEFLITAEGLTNSDTTIEFDDITTPIVKNVVVEPKYVDYAISLSYTGDVNPKKEKEMKLSISSTMGRYYEHARIVAEAVTEAGATVQLLGKDEQGLEHDVIQSGWGDAAGYKIGGVVNQNLNLRGIFSNEGKYTITIKLINRDASDAVIASKAFDVNVVSENITPPQETPEEKPTTPTNPEKVEKLPESLPKTGYNVLAISVAIMLALAGVYVSLNKKS